ncbi:MAG: TonB-dependent receptor [Desulfovibrio sp.]|jgi:iron complex outermembrane receptor protein|nr:TonB-dependent receptor [Desulfovibrio sp.]
MPFKCSFPIAGIIALLLLFSGSASAAETPAQGVSAPHTLPTVTVTAQKREENVQQVPESVGVISDTVLEEKRIQEFLDLSQKVPNLNIATSGGPATYTYIGIRGRTNDSGDVEPPVTVLVDGVPYDDFQSMSALPLFDVERVEVLRGPQSTMYGMNSEAGVINIVTKQPGKTLRAMLGGNLTTGLNTETSWSLRGSVSGPVVEDVLSLGLAFTGSRAGSYIDNKGTGSEHYGKSDIGAFRLSAVFTPTDIFDATLHFGYSHVEADNGYIALPATDAAARTIGWSERKKYRANIDYDEKSRVDTTTADLHMRLKTAYADIISVSALRYSNQYYGTDFDLGMPFPPPYPPGMGQFGTVDNSFRTFTQELRVQSPKDDNSPFEWLAGIFFHDFERKSDMRMGMTMFGKEMPGTRAPVVDGTLWGKSLALFGQGTYRFFDKKLGLTVGLRQEWTEREFEDRLYLRGDKIRNYDAQFLPKFSLDYRITPENMVYATVAMGWRPGGVYNMSTWGMGGMPIPLSKDAVKFDKETSWTYEIGTKNEFFDKRLQLNAALFYSVYKDYQDIVYVTPMSTFLRNADEARMYGFEVDAEGRITDSLTASLAFGYVHARYETYKDDFNDFSGRTVIGVPNFNGSFALKYSFLDGFYVRPEVRLTGDTYWDRNNDNKQEPYLTLHARAGYAADKWEVYIYGDNLTNQYAFTRAMPMVGDGSGMFGSPIRPLEVGIGFNINF